MKDIVASQVLGVTVAGLVVSCVDRGSRLAAPQEGAESGDQTATYLSRRHVSTTLVGRLTRDPDLRFTNSGKAVANFSLAVNRKRGDEDVVSFFDVTVWDTLASGVAETLHKGDRAIVEGNLQQESYENKEGKTVSKIVLVANNVGPDLRFATAVIHQTNNKTKHAAFDEDDF